MSTYSHYVRGLPQGEGGVEHLPLCFLEITPSCARVKGGHAGHVGEIDRTAAAVIPTNDSDTMPVMMLILTC